MTRPGDRVRRLAMRCCSERTRRRLIDPAVADLQAEVAAARRTGSAWQTVRAFVAGYGSILKVMIIGLCGELRSAATWEREEATRARRGAWVALGIIIVSTVLLELPLLRSMSSTVLGVGERVRMATYLAPSTLALSAPLGFAVATAWALHGAARRRKVAAAALLAAALTAPAMFANLGWVTPDANQAFRETVLAHHVPPVPVPVRGDGELRLGDLRDRLRQARDGAREQEARNLETLYYRKWAMSATPLAMVGLIVALAFRRPWTRAGLIAMACGVYAGQYALLLVTFPLADAGMARPIVLEWAGNTVYAAAAVLITSLRWRRPA
ncbi:MAG TPA: LptF/LptG family permease [Vicinamibacterales bacterium]|jgi:lipopolysaccharide export LptBFGC system permease protein LptF|nr:LptF/LptG family permease [Vicinamibacterales bacterium]